MAHVFINDKPVKFRNWKCNVEKARYSNNRISLILTEVGTFERIAIATVNLPDEELKEDEVIIKDYSENDGMLEALVLSGIVSKPIGAIPTGYVHGYICKMLV